MLHPKPVPNSGFGWSISVISGSQAHPQPAEAGCFCLPRRPYQHHRLHPAQPVPPGAAGWISSASRGRGRPCRQRYTSPCCCSSSRMPPWAREQAEEGIPLEVEAEAQAGGGDRGHSKPGAVAPEWYSPLRPHTAAAPAPQGRCGRCCCQPRCSGGEVGRRRWGGQVTVGGDAIAALLQLHPTDPNAREGGLAAAPSN